MAAADAAAAAAAAKGSAVRNIFSTGMLETLRALADGVAASDILPRVLAVRHRSILPIPRVSILAVFRIMYVCTD